ncbi:EamA family transporter RarD [Glaesserella parasuis]|uniref:DMT superfamily drug/metabolite transporter n=1 Tax=Glaesserella parasuis serovar 5 (strain SH0165) TaxID=557723 RepID=B8F697_GLAP5|nr:EamA family transporter RarD [Glaesserella parasuis]ACL32849.1 DMT superfamily drug/metabolite transporter [Glaesserella parasuis SH0165]EMY46825.1 DMT superfamily drug/metabolite transporter [Glaesserella parasuis gx033]MDG6238777.1 EamA family transporter RarD [Glaesserella parasuis]MDG6279522.1 EamA family transporter RarD [Glaesserella parasuis]MDG6358774.1 EamA family transporter RarD [Glaesserella parasuis]
MLKGILFSLSANILFGAGYYFAVLLRPLESDSIFGFRIVVLMPFILLAIFLFHQQKAFKDLYYRVKQTPYLIFILLLLALNTAIQLWLFLWAPNNNQAIEVSIGYLLLPIVAVALGKLVFKEHFTLLKWLALFFATIGVTINIFLTASISWATFVAGFGYPIYIVLRRYFHINNLATFFVELLLLLPFAIYYIAQVDQDYILMQNEYLYFYLALLGLVNGMAFILYIASSNLLPINVLGLLGYAEPLVMLFISFAIGEVLDAKSYILMACLAVSIILLSVDSFRKVKP